MIGHPEFVNRTPFEFSPLFVLDERGRPIVVVIAKATFDIARSGELALAEEQRPVDFEGRHHGEPGQSSYRNEPELALHKPGTDVVLVGHAHVSAHRQSACDVEFRVGKLARQLRVSGDRRWVKSFSGIAATPPQPFEAIPLIYERAYGGWDRSPEDPHRHGVLATNPIGVGYRTAHARFQEGSLLPNIEDPRALLTSYQGRSVAAGVGFTAPHWEPRRSFAGTYDTAWARERSPLLPSDFDRRFFNAASPGLVAPEPLRGDELVSVRGASASGQVGFRLPGVPAPAWVIATRDGETRTVAGNLDTVVVDLDAWQLVMLWRANTSLRDGPLDVRSIEARVDWRPPHAVARERRGNVIPLRPALGA